MISVLLHTATHFKWTISSSFQSQSTLFWELFKWEKICNLVEIGGIVMFNNLFYVNNFCIEICIDFCLYMLSIIVLGKKIGIGKNRYWQVTFPKNRKSESVKKIAIGASLLFINKVAALQLCQIHNDIQTINRDLARFNAACAIALAPQFKRQVNPLYLSLYYYST